MTRWPSVDVAPTPSGWARPGNLMPAVGPSSWPRGRRAASEAEEILASAEAWWDVERSGFRDGDRYLRNIGTAGSVLNLRLGSSGVANSNDPKWLGPEDTGYVYLPGVASNSFSVPNETALQITGDIDVRVLVRLDSWKPSADMALIGKWVGATASDSWYLRVRTTGTVTLETSNGTAQISHASTTSTGLADGAVSWVRATLQVNNGASGHTVKFYLSDDGSTWNQFGSDVVTAGTTTINSNTAVVAVGTIVGALNTSGRFYRAQVLNGINGTTVLDVDCDAITSGSAASFVATSGQTVTINRSTSGRKSVAMPSKTKGGRPCMALGTDDYLECQDSAQHGLLNFAGQMFTFMVTPRIWGTTSSYVLSKGIVTGAGGGTDMGWVLRNVSGTIRSQTQREVGTTRTDAIEPSAYANGSLTNHATTYDATAQTSWLGASAGARTNHLDGSLRNSYPFRVGCSTQSSSFTDMEFRAAAIWRRALTTRELATITNAAPWGV